MPSAIYSSDYVSSLIFGPINLNHLIRKAAADGLVSYFRQETQIPSVGECERASDQDEKALAPNRKI